MRLSEALYVGFPCVIQGKATLDFQLFFADSALPPHFHKLSALLLLQRINDSFCLDS